MTYDKCFYDLRLITADLSVASKYIILKKINLVYQQKQVSEQFLLILHSSPGTVVFKKT